MTEPGRQRPEHRREKPPIPSLGIKINVQRMMDHNCERGRSAKSVKRLEVTLAAYNCHCTFLTIESLKSISEQAHGERETVIARRLRKRRFYNILRGNPSLRQENGFDG